MHGMLLPTMMTVVRIHHHLLHLLTLATNLIEMTMMTNTKEYVAVETAGGTIVLMATTLYATTILQVTTMA